MAYATNSTPIMAGLADRAAGLWQQLSEWNAARARYTETFRELSALSNRDLADLGISRSMIRSLALEAMHRK